MTAGGQVPRNAFVTLSDINGQTRSAAVNRRGRYHFEGLEAGRAYFLTVDAKGYNFTPATAVVTPTFDVESLNFTAVRRE